MRKIIFDFKEIKQDENPIHDDNKSKDKIKKDNTEKMFDYINSIMGNENYGIGLHSTYGENIKDILNSIMKNGLEIEEKKKILSTVS